MSCHSEAMNWIPANVTVYRSTFEGLARCGQPKPLPLYLCLNHIWQQVPSTQRMSVFGLLPSCWQARQTMSTHRWDIRQAGWDPLDGEYPLSGFPYSQSMKWFLPRAEMQLGLFGFLLKNPLVILEKASKFSTTKNPARNQRRGNTTKVWPWSPIRPAGENVSLVISCFKSGILMKRNNFLNHSSIRPLPRCDRVTKISLSFTIM